MSRLEPHDKLSPDKGELKDHFPNEFLFVVEYTEPLWCADIINHLACGVMPQELTYSQRKKFLFKVKHYYWDDPILYKVGVVGLIRRCVPNSKVISILTHYHNSLYGGHFGANRTISRVLESGFF